MLPNDILLEVFDFYRVHAMQIARGSPWKWLRLAHVCRRWRCILSNSPRRLGLRIQAIVNYRGPTKGILDSWPTLPIVIWYNESQKSKANAVNKIIVALHHPDRVCEIGLGVTSSMLGSLVTLLEKPFTALECVQIKSNDSKESPLVLPGTFLGGSTPRLQSILLDGLSLPSPALKRLLLSASDLVTLELYHMPSTGFISPEDIFTGLSTLLRLKKLSLHFNSPPSPTSISESPPPQTRVTLPYLSYLKFHGTTEYLEDLVSRIKLPVLRYFRISFFNQLIFGIPQFCQSIDLMDAQRSPTEVMVLFSWHCVVITLTRNTGRQSFSGEFYFRCMHLDWQLSAASQIVSQLSPFFSNVRSLNIRGLQSAQRDALITEEVNIDSAQWLDLFHPFSDVRSLIVAEEFVPDVSQVLRMAATDYVLPALTSLTLKGYIYQSELTRQAAEHFVRARRRLGRFIRLEG
jgi:F-box-like